MPVADLGPDPRVTGGGYRAAATRLLPIALAVVGVLGLVAIAILGASSAGRGYDFQAYWDAGERLLGGGSAYDPSTLAGPYSPGPHGLYLYPPPLAVLLLPLHVLGYPAAETLWVAVRIVALAAACWLLPVSRPIRLAVLGTTALSDPALLDVNLGNVSIVVLLLAAGGWRYLERPAGSFMVALAIALRAPMAALLVWPTLRRRWKPVVWTLVSGGILVLVTLPVVGISGYADYLRVLGNLRSPLGALHDSDLGSAVLALGASPEIAGIALIGGYAIAGVAIVLSLRRDAEVGYVVAATAALLLSPVMWPHYLVLLALPAALIAARRWPAAVALPLLGWLPEMFLPFVVVAATIAPLALRPTDQVASSSPTA